MTDSTELMPAALLGHGSPMNALELNRFSRSSRAFGQRIPRPRDPCRLGALVRQGRRGDGMPRPRTIRDFLRPLRTCPECRLG